MANEVFALHLDGELLHPNIWDKYTEQYGNNSLYGWRPPKKLYYKIGHAKTAIKHLPEQIRDRVTIVRYTPENEMPA